MEIAHTQSLPGVNFRVFNQSVYRNRRSGLKKKVGKGLILLSGNDESSINYKDNHYPFRQDSHYLYYFGLNIAGLAAIIDADSGEEIIFGNDVSMEEIVWTGALPTIAEMAAAVGVTATLSYDAIQPLLLKATASKRAIHFVPPFRPENKMKLAEWLQVPVAKLESMVSDELVRAILSQRLYKEPGEVEELHHAALISANMHEAILRNTRPGMKEQALIGLLQQVAFEHNAGMSFAPILTIQGQTLHNTYRGNTLKEGDLVLCDAGAANDMQYAGDLTTTFPVGAKYSSRQKELYAIVLAAQEHAVSLLKPGIAFKEVHLAAAACLLNGLKEIGLVNGDIASALEEGVHSLFYPHGLGHLLGLDVHDMEDLGEDNVGYTETIRREVRAGLRSLRLGRTLESGFALTIEPGLYFIPQLIDRWKAENKHSNFINYALLEKYRNAGGIRIEEDYLITDKGSRQLGKRLPKTPEEIEALVVK